MPTYSNLFFKPTCAISTAIAITGTVAIAQTTTVQTEGNTWIGVVTTDDALIRCGANESYYPVAEPKNGDLVLVSGKRQNWLKIKTAGSVFSETVGYIKYPATNTDLLVVKNKNGTVVEDVDVVAKNIESDDLYRSWRPILRLTNGETVQIINTEITEPGTLHRESFVVQTIALPSTGDCWIDGSFVERATAEQVSVFYGVDQKKIDESKTITKEVVDVGNFENETQTVTTEPEKLQPLSLAELEVSWEKITAEPAIEAEVEGLCDMYSELLNTKRGDLVVEQVAGGRIKQLKVWVGLKKQREKIISLRDKLAQKSGEVSEYQTIMNRNGEYAAVGVLALSNTFDGRLRPLMYRIQDLKSGRTIGYIPENEDLDLSALVGQSVGIAGNLAWNSNWRVSVIEGERFDLLSPTTAIVTPDIQ